MKTTARAFLSALLVLFLAGCAAGPNIAAELSGPDVAGFWLGLWHGFISPITFLVSLFNQNVNIYEVLNNGGWYNFGFLIGVSAFFSGGPSAAMRNGSRGARHRTPAA